MGDEADGEAVDPETGAGCLACGNCSGRFWPQALTASAAAHNIRVVMALVARRRVGVEAAPTLRVFTFFMGSQSSPSRAPFRLPMTPTPLTDADYDARTDAVLTSIESDIDAWLDDDVVDIDQHRTGGLLELEFPDRSKIVVNTQPPLHELWLASRRGGYHFKFVDGQWIDTKDGVAFFARLSEEASHHAGKTLAFSAV